MADSAVVANEHNPVPETDVSESLAAARHRHAGLVSREASLSTRISELNAEIDRRTDGLRDGSLPNAAELNTLAMELADRRREMVAVMGELTSATAEVSRLEDAVRRRDLAIVFERMEKRRTHCIELARELSLEMGLLFGQDQRAAGKLAIPNARSIERLRFNSLTRPISIAGDGNGDGWLDRHRYVILDYEFILKINPMQEL